ncbi:YdcH family protein [Caldimonas tepidiphila]|uniref:YdcH family protein n=1 Tax=Caldimonas tepidiphila TaxID=2315841 RepID=UPI000E5A2CD2|nr:DUF465 domain-containing protein [Caldimonas tepidiphila]
MIVEPHSLSRDFPELKERIHSLKSDAHFARLQQEYETLDRQICRFEEGIEHASDEEVERLKMRRVHLKDELYGLLKG